MEIVRVPTKQIERNGHVSLDAPTEQIEKNDHVSLDINKLKESLQEELKTLHDISDKCSIYTVPTRLRASKEYAYTPQTVSIGPIHHGKEELQEMEVHKKQYLQEFLEWGKVPVEEYIKAIAKETALRNYYANNFKNITTEDFVKMVLLDSSFVIMVFLKQCANDFRNDNDKKIGEPWMKGEVKSDMCLLENQIPFFILDKLLKLANIQIEDKAYSMIELTRDFFSAAFGVSWVPKDTLKQINFSKVEHFVDFLRICQQPCMNKVSKTPESETITTLSVMELHQSGVKFQKGSTEKIFDINFDFKKGILQIPPLFFQDHTEKLLRNLHAFEQCKQNGGFVSDYITTINFLVRATNDVKILSKKGIIGDWLSDNDAVMRVLHDLNRKNSIDSKKFYFADVVENLNKFCKKRRHRWIADLKQNYFRNPWVSISVVAAGALLILTVIQAVCSVIQVT